MPKDYVLTRGSDLKAARGDPAHTDERTIKSVEAAFARIRSNGEHLGAWDGDRFAGSRYTIRQANHGGFLNHFQGMMRLRDGRYLVVSGGDWQPNTINSHLFIIRMESRPDSGPWRSNVIESHEPPEADAVVKIIGVDESLWHGGGLDVLGDILAVPIEHMTNKTLKAFAQVGPKGPDNSALVFFDVSDPENPKRFPQCTIRRQGVKAGAVALTKLLNGHFLAASWSDSDREERRLEFYLSNSTRFADGFRRIAPTRWVPAELRALEGQDFYFRNYQAINLVRQSEDGRLYLMGFQRVEGRDTADLFTVDIPREEDAPKAGRGIDKPIITKVASREFVCRGRCDMRGASGLYSDRGELIIYSGDQFRTPKGIFRLAEFSAPFPVGLDTISKRVDAWVELYAGTHFRGRFLTLVDLRRDRGTIRDFKKIRVGGEKFGDTVSSVRFQLPKGSTYRLFKHDRFRRKLVDLVGSGRVEELPDLGKNAGETSSSRLL